MAHHFSFKETKANPVTQSLVSLSFLFNKPATLLLLVVCDDTHIANAHTTKVTHDLSHDCY